MSPKTKRLLELIKRSRKQVGLGHIDALVRDAEKLGRQAFLLSAADAIDPSVRSGERFSNATSRRRARRKHAFIAATHPLQRKLEGFQLRTGYNRKTFLACLIDAIGTHHGGVRPLAKKNWTFPKFLRYYGDHLSINDLEAIALEVAEKNSRAH
jgi:hypothetical protein